MSNRGLAVLGLRLFALFLFYHSLTALPAVYAVLAGTDPLAADPRYYYLAAAAHLGPAVLALLIWAFVGRWVDLILPQRTAAAAPEPASAEEWQAIAFAAVGMFLFVGGLPELLGRALQAHELTRRLDTLGSELGLALGVAALRVALGLGLLVSARRLSGFFMHLRRLGVTAGR